MTESKNEWECKMCAFSNASQIKSCQMCTFSNASSNDSELQFVCSKCTFRNRSSAKLCEICGESLQKVHQHQSQNNETIQQSKQPTELELKVKIRSNNEPELEDKNKTAAMERQIFKYNKYDMHILGVLMLVGSIILVFGVVDILPIFYVFIAFIGYIISIIMAVLLNSDNIPFKKRIKILGISYFVVLAILCLLSATFVDMSTSGYITTTSLLSSWIIIIIMFFYEYDKKAELAVTVKYLLNVKSLIIPVFAHFADIATDFGVTYEYYQRSRLKHDIIDYKTIYYISIFILFVSRFMGAAVIWQYTRSLINSLLQFFDLYLLKILSLEWKLKYQKAGRVHQFIGLIESIFESAPQAIISVYILIVDNNKSIVIWISSILSILSIAFRSISQDTRFFSTKSNSKELGWNTDNGAECSKSRCLFCNHPFLLRVIWRLIDVTSYIIFCALFWYYLGGLFLGVIIAIEVCMVAYYAKIRWDSQSELNVYWLYSLLIILPSSWDSGLLEDRMSIGFGIIRVLFNMLIMEMIYNKNPDGVFIVFDVDLCLMVISYAFYMWFVARQGCYACPCRCGNNWVDSRVVTTLSIAGCNTLEEIRDLQKEGVEITQYLNRALTWQIYPRPNDLIHIINELNYDLGEHLKWNYFVSIGLNRNLDSNIDKTDIKMVVQYLKQYCDINVKAGMDRTPLELAHLCHKDKSWINAFLEEGSNFDAETCGQPTCWDICFHDILL